jgi:uncharacterized delta-60 repeat protein
VLAGGTNDWFSQYFGLARYNADGTLDQTFGTGGKVKTDFYNSGVAWAAAYDVAIQTDGKIVAVGCGSTADGDRDFALARYNTDGSRATTFGAGGIVITDFFQRDDVAYAATLGPDGRIIVGGYTGSAFSIACYLAKGSPNITGAGVSGKKLFVYGTNFDDSARIYLDGEGQKTKYDSANSNAILIGKKAGRKIAPGQTVTLQVRCPDGRESSEYRFTRPVE